tara:strand:- start:77 stop:409 length:333 start_codon:yes stop_codon:yes gene_type:complete
MSKEKVWQEKRIAESQARKSLRTANPKRQYGEGAVPRFQYKSSALIDMFAHYVDEQMLFEPNTGKGCRVQPHHVESCFIKLNRVILLFMEEERKNVIIVREALRIKEEEE